MGNSQEVAPPTVSIATVVEGGAGSASQPSVTSLSTVTTAGEAFDKSDLARNRVMHLHATIGPACNGAVAFFIGEDPFARNVYCVGLAMMVVSNFWLYRLTFHAERYQTRFAGGLWIVAMTGMQSAWLFWGPFSGAVIVAMLATALEAIGRERWTALLTMGLCIGGHLATAIPVIAGWTHDVGFLQSLAATTGQQILAEVMIVVSLISAYLFGRAVRNSAADAFSDLESARRIIGDREQALAEVAADAERQNRANEGRWTDHTFGPWKLGLVLGRGAMGEVYEAVGKDGKLAALKLLNAGVASSPDLVERFYREMQVAASLDSPHIVQVFQLSPPDSPVPYIAMERLTGTDLATRLRNETDNRLAMHELETLISQVARGLEVASAAGIVHRDLKPHNLFFQPGSGWKILDFGVSKVLDSEGTLTGEGIVGTPQYMAPEQASGGQVSHLADVYALGAIAYRCLTGRSPFKGTDIAELVYQVVHMPPARPSTLGIVPKVVEDVLAIAMAKDPRKRFPTALAFAQAFLAAQHERKPALDVPDKAWL